jgi:acetyl esterase
MLAVMFRKFFRFVFAGSSKLSTLSKYSLAPAQRKVVKLVSIFPTMDNFNPTLARYLLRIIETLFSIDKENMYCVKNTKIKDNLIGIRTYYPISMGPDQQSGAIVFYHGGGCVIGSVDTHDTLCRFIAKQAGLVVLSVDYRLAPEHKFPIPIEDSIYAWNWIVENAEDLAINLNKTGVAGDSAGGYLATSVCLQYLKPVLRNKPLRMPAFQWLLYPMLDLRRRTESFQRCNSGMILTRDLAIYFHEHFINDLSEIDNPVVSPVLTETLQGLPPTYILTLSHDPLMDEGQSYAAKLEQDGCTVFHQHSYDNMHGFPTFAGVCDSAKNTLVVSINGFQSLVPNINR